MSHTLGFIQAVPSNRQKSKQSEQERKAKAEQLRRVFAREKVRHGWTQQSLADKMGIKQGTLGGYLSGRYTVSTDFIIQMAQALSISPEDFEPGLTRSLTRTALTGRVNVKVPILGSISGSLTARDRRFSVTSVLKEKRDTMLFGINIDTNAYEPGVFKGSVAIVDPLAEIANDSYVVTQHVGENGYEIFRIKEVLNDGRYTVAVLPFLKEEKVIDSADFTHFCKVVNFEMP